MVAIGLFDPNITFGIFSHLLHAVTQNESHLFALGLVCLLWFGIFITFIVFLCLPPKEDENKWGRNPLLPDTGLNDRMSDQSL